MLLGFIAVFSAIVYKLGLFGDDGDGAPAGAAFDARVDIPAGARLVSTEMEGNRALLRIEGADGGTSLLLIDLGSGAVLGRFALQPG